LIHGGVRYLQQGNLRLVRESLRERGLLTRNAPHLVRHLGFVVPNYTWWEGPFYTAGLKIYDKLAGKLGLGPSRHLSKAETLKRISTLEPRGLRGGTIYYDGQFDDARLAITLAQTAADAGGVLLNYMPATALTKHNGTVRGAIVRDAETGREYEVATRVVINAAGIFTDAIRRFDDRAAPPTLALSRGTHIVLPRRFLPGESAIMVPRTDDGRVLFAIPWHDRVLVGTTDNPVTEPSLEPRPSKEEIEFLLVHAARYLATDPVHDDVLSTFAGLRPLVQISGTKQTSLVPRDHWIQVSESGLVTITGGKWTTFRKMAEDTINRATKVAGLLERPCSTTKLRLHGWHASAETDALDTTLKSYGSDAAGIRALLQQEPALEQRLHPQLPYRLAEIVWAIRHEMARTVEDVLSRRTRALLLDARASIEAAPLVAKTMRRELNQDVAWEKKQVSAYRELAKNYLPAR
jgi:glycerol-3-phosphate dehydrogenase